jgi:arginine/lysine/ornithine decarboxylase
MFAPSESIPITGAEGRILADPSVSCPPAVPILVSGEKISKEAMACFAYYGMDSCLVIKQSTETS